jgi:hypothetical protein
LHFPTFNPAAVLRFSGSDWKPLTAGSCHPIPPNKSNPLVKSLYFPSVLVSLCFPSRVLRHSRPASRRHSYTGQGVLLLVVLGSRRHPAILPGRHANRDCQCAVAGRCGPRVPRHSKDASKPPRESPSRPFSLISLPSDRHHEFPRVPTDDRPPSRDHQHPETTVKARLRTLRVEIPSYPTPHAIERGPHELGLLCRPGRGRARRHRERDRL